MDSFHGSGILLYLNVQNLYIYSKKNKRNFIHLSRSKLHYVVSLNNEFQYPKIGTYRETVKSSVKYVLREHT